MDEPLANIPHTIGIIMDGNRRYAKARGLPTPEGHRLGYQKLRDVADWARDAGVKEMIVYAFSTENWNRAKEEVGYLMNLFREVIAPMVAQAKANDTRLFFLGERSMLSSDIVNAITSAEKATEGGKAFHFGIALSYGGRAEILDAIRRIPEGKRDNITEEEFSKLLYTNNFRDPDLIIRTSGEERLSNFLPWQSVYSEIVFTKTLWPDFSKEEFFSILRAYGARERRMGK